MKGAINLAFGASPRRLVVETISRRRILSRPARGSGGRPMLSRLTAQFLVGMRFHSFAAGGSVRLIAAKSGVAQRRGRPAADRQDSSAPPSLLELRQTGQRREPSAPRAQRRP